jgi:CheY-like chemotaxis protein
LAIKVLVVDTTSNAQRLCKETLSPLGCQIITASSTALAVFLARKNFPSLIVNGVSAGEDIDLPQEIHNDPELAHIPVVVLYENGDQAAAQRAASCGATKAIHLPLTPERLFEELRSFLHESEDDRPEDTPE